MTNDQEKCLRSEKKKNHNDNDDNFECFHNDVFLFLLHLQLQPIVRMVCACAYIFKLSTVASICKLLTFSVHKTGSKMSTQRVNSIKAKMAQNIKCDAEYLI